MDRTSMDHRPCNKNQINAALFGRLHFSKLHMHQAAISLEKTSDDNLKENFSIIF